VWGTLTKGLACSGGPSLYIFLQSYCLHLFVLCGLRQTTSAVMPLPFSVITTELFLGVFPMSIRAACIPGFGGVFFYSDCGYAPSVEPGPEVISWVFLSFVALSSPLYSPALGTRLVPFGI